MNQTRAGKPAAPTDNPFVTVLIGCLLLLPTLDSAAVNFPLRWRWSNPRPHGNNIVDMAYSPVVGLGVQVTERGQLYTSDDLSNWLPRESGVTNALRAVTFFGARIVITGEAGVVLYADSPANFRPGTLDGPTGDWLEAVAASPQTVVAVGDNGAVYTSSNGASWRRQNSGTLTWLRGVAFGNNTFVAVGENGFIATSPDGTDWNDRISGTVLDLNRVAFTGNFFTAVGESGLTLISTPSGSTWSPETTGATNDLIHAASGDGARLVIGEHEVRLQNSVGWSNQLAQPDGPPAWTYYANLGLEDFFLIAGHSGMIVEGYSTNSSSYFWLPTSDSIRQWLFDVTWATNLYVAVGDRATVMTSGDGIDWSLESVPDSVTNSIFLGVGGTTNLLLAAGNQGSLIYSPYAVTNITVTNIVGTNVVVTNKTVSTFGVLWYAIQPRPTINDLQGVSAFRNLYLVTGDNGTVLTSSNGTNWTPCITPTTALLSSVAASADIVVATGDDGAILRSEDGLIWTQQSSPTTNNWLYRVRYLAGQFITVGQNGTILTSANGTNWTARVSGTAQWLTDVTWIDGVFFVVGTQGTVLTSTDAVDWTRRGTITLKSFYAAATDTNRLITVGVEGLILRSQIVPDLTPVNILNYAQYADTNAATVNNLFLFGGKADQRFTLDSRLAFNANSWVTGPQLEFYDSSGTFFYLETLPRSNAPPQQFYRATLTP
jgi:hypothetical protein